MLAGQAGNASRIIADLKVSGNPDPLQRQLAGT